MIYYFTEEEREHGITGQMFIDEKHDHIPTHNVDVTKRLKAYYTCADELFNRKEVKAEILSSAFVRLLAGIESIKKDIDKANQGLYYLTHGNALLRQAQMVSETYAFDIALYNYARIFFQKVEKNDSFLSYLAQYNEIKCERDIDKYRYRYQIDKTLKFEAKTKYDQLCKQISQLQKENQLDQYVTQDDILRYSIQIDIGRCDQNRNHFQEAKEQYKKILNSPSIWPDKTWKDTWDQLMAFNEKNNVALEESELLKRLNPHNPSTMQESNRFSHLLQILVNLMICESEISGENSRAEEIGAFILKINPNNIDAHNNLGIILRKKEQYARAIEEFDQVINLLNREKEDHKKGNDYIFDEVCPKDRFALLGMAKCFIKQQKYIKAKELIDKIKVYYPHDKEILLWEAMWYRDQQRFEQAISILEKLLKDHLPIAPGTIGLKANYVMGTCYLGWGYPSQAKQCFERIKKTLESQKQSDVLSQMDLGWSKQLLGDYKGAIEEYQSIDINYIEQKVKISIFNNMGQCYLYQKEYSQAIEQFKKAMEEKTNARTCCLMAHGLRHMETMEERYSGALCEYLQERLQVQQNIEEKQKVCKEQKNKTPSILAAGFAILAKELSPCDPDVNSEYVLCLKQALTEPLPSGCQQSLKGRLDHFLMDPYGPRELCIEALIVLHEYGELKDNFYEVYTRFHPIKRGACAHQLYELLYCEEYENLPRETQGKIAIQIYQMQKAINEIKQKRRVKKGGSAQTGYVHYTRIKALKALLSTTSEQPPRFRLSNIAYMNDPSEGDSFGALLYNMAKQQEQAGPEENKIDGEKAEKILSDFNLLDNHVCEIGFLGDRNVYTTSLSSQRDAIYMWGIYADNGKGCCIQFNEDFFQIRGNYPESFIPYYSENDSYPLYQMCYLQQGQGEKYSAALKTDDENIGQDLKEILDALQKIHDELEQEKEVVRKAIYGRVMSILDQVRYLFKYQEYQQEEEFRSIIVTKDFKLDEKGSEIPSLYAEIDKEIRLEEVRLGPNVQNGGKIEAWLYATHRVNKVTRSARHYR